MTTRTFFTTLVLSGLYIITAPLSASAAISEPGFESETIASGLTLPTAMAFAPGGRIFITEKSGTVRVVQDGVLQPTPVITLTDINTFGDRGLLGIATDPQFLNNGYLYLSYTYENSPGSNFSGPKTGRIVRVTVVNNQADESSKVVLVGTIGGTLENPSCENFLPTDDCIPSDSSSHSVGGLRFGPDGKLYATLGDGANFDYADPLSLRAQNLDSLAGKLIRINTDGTAPADNPYFNGDADANRSKVYAYGLRNAFRLAFHPTSNKLYVSDVGWSSWEEINAITPGANYGWPCREGNGATTHNCTALNYTNPTYAYPHDANGAGSVVAGGFPHSGAYPAQYNNSFFIGDYAQNWIKRMDVSATGTLIGVYDFMDDPNGPVDIVTGPDGTVYYLSIYTGELNHITHTSGNRRPVVVLNANPTSGLLPLSVQFSTAGTYDPDGDTLSTEWNFGDGTIVTGTTSNPVHSYSATGTYQATVIVSDARGATQSKSITIVGGNQAPTASIDSPESGSFYVPLQNITLTGSASDLEDGANLPASAFEWDIILHHNTHTHVIQQFSGTKNPTFTAPDHNATDVFTEVILRVTDSAGLTNTRSIYLYLNTASVGGNLIENPSMESSVEFSDRPHGWLYGWYGVLTPIFTYPVPGLEGVRAAQVTLTSHQEGSAKWFFDPLFVEAGKTYDFESHYTSDVITTQYAVFGFADGTYQYVWLGDLAPSATPAHVAHAITMPAGIQTFTVFHELAYVGELVTDDFSLVRRGQTETIPPTITFTAPAAQATISGVTALAAGASDASGIAGVTFTINGAIIGAEDVTFPYSVEWNSALVANGTHTLSAIARDTNDNTAITSVDVVVSNGGTTELITNGTFELGLANLPTGWTANSWGNHTAVFSYPVSSYNGSQAARLEITSYPFITGSGDAKWVFAKVPVTPGTIYSYTDHYRSNTISDIIGQYTMQDGSFHYFGLAKEIQPTTSWNSLTATFTPPVNATHVTLFHLISAVGYLEIDDASLTVVGNGTPSETEVPIVTFTNPIEGQIVSGTTTITASSSDNVGVTYVFYAVNGIPITGQLTQAPYAFAWNTRTLSDGTHILKATTHDPSGNNSTHTISVVVDNSTQQPPVANLIANPSLETPNGGDPASWFRGGWGANNAVFTYPIAGSEGSSGARVAITNYTNGDAKWYFADVPVNSGTEYTFSHQYKSTAPSEVLVRYATAAGYQYQYIGALASTASWATNVFTFTPPTGATSATVFHVLASVGTLDIDNVVLTNPVAQVDVTAPTISITAPSAGATVLGTALLDATATDAIGVAGVRFFVDGVPVGTEDTESPYSATWDSNSIPNGTHIITAQARDAAGNIGFAQSVSVTVANTSNITNLIQNPSLETTGPNNTPLNWSQSRWGSNTTVFSYPVAGAGGSSTKAARLDMSDYQNGDAKWYFANVPVQSGTLYTFTHSYRSDVVSGITIRYTRPDNSVFYVGLGALPPALQWNTQSHTIVIPANVTSMTIFHTLTVNGFLEVDDYLLSNGTSDAFANGMISYTFDDGWITQYTNALPVLTAANAKGGFYIITNATLNADPLELVANPSLETGGGNNTPANWLQGGWGTNNAVHTYPVAGTDGTDAAEVAITGYTDGDAKWFFADVPVIEGGEYIVQNQYRADVPTSIVMRYTDAEGVYTYQYIETLPATGNVWASYQTAVIIPSSVVSMTMFHVLAQVGVLTVDNYSVKTGEQIFVNPAQVLALEAAGHEIGSHTLTHPYLTTLGAGEENNEIEDSRAALLAMGVDVVDTLVYPYGDYDQDTKVHAQSAGYSGARSVDRGYNTKSTDRYALKIQQIDRTTTMADVEAWVAQAQADNTWLILMFHQIDAVPEHDLGATPEFLAQIIAHAQAVGIENVTMGEGLARMNP
jgi:glucose/arabinose dehydrogenase/peptidoglycan/xylan/chitin deacetylase (PgdA/CDA1 family)